MVVELMLLLVSRLMIVVFVVWYMLKLFVFRMIVLVLGGRLRWLVRLEGVVIVDFVGCGGGGLLIGLGCWGEDVGEEYVL